MYLNFFGLNQEPFHITPDPEFLYLSPTHKEAFAAVIYGIERRKGFVAITGEVGTGKTTILRAYLKRVAQEKATLPIYLFNPDLTFEELLEVCARELEIDTKNLSTPAILEKIHLALIEQFRNGRNVVLLIDEAQNMPTKTMERLRMLSNLETTKDKLLQIVLVGQPELAKKLQAPSLRQLRQRLVLHARIKPLTRAQSVEYIHFRLTHAGGSLAVTFTRGALDEILDRTGGNPRLINILCDNALVSAYGDERKPVPRHIVKEVWAEMRGRRKRTAIRIAAAAGITIMAAAAGTLYYADGSVRAIQDIAARFAATRFAAPPAPPAPAPPSPPTTQPASSSQQSTAAAPAPPATATQSPPAESPSPTPAPSVSADILSSLMPPISLFPEAPAPAAASPQPVPEPPHDSVLAVKKIEEGDCLSHLLVKTYGYCNDSLIRIVQDQNPQMANPDIIVVGESIKFPLLPESTDHPRSQQQGVNTQ